MARPFSFRHIYDIRTVLEPWRQELGADYEIVVSRLMDRDRQLEEHLSLGMGQGQLSIASGAGMAINNGGDQEDVSLRTTLIFPTARRISMSVYGLYTMSSGAAPTAMTLKFFVDGAHNPNTHIFSTPPLAAISSATFSFVAFIEVPAGSHDFAIFVRQASVAATTGSTTQPRFVIEDIGPPL